MKIDKEKLVEEVQKVYLEDDLKKNTNNIKIVLQTWSTFEKDLSSQKEFSVMYRSELNDAIKSMIKEVKAFLKNKEDLVISLSATDKDWLAYSDFSGITSLNKNLKLSDEFIDITYYDYSGNYAENDGMAPWPLNTVYISREYIYILEEIKLQLDFSPGSIKLADSLINQFNAVINSQK